MLEEYEFHEEAKCADASGAPCGKQTVGLLQRRHVTIEWPPRFIGKESNKLEEIEEGSVPDAGDVYTEYLDPRRQERDWHRVVETLRAMTKRQLRELEKRNGISLTTLKAWRRGRTHIQITARSWLGLSATDDSARAKSTTLEHQPIKVALQLLAPSIVPLVNTDRAPNGRPDPTWRLTVLLGAGASLYAGSPSTDDLTSIVAGREISGAILRALRSRCETSAANFEDVLHVLEELDALLGTTRSRAPSMLRPLIEPSSILNGITIDSSLLRRERYELLEAIAAAFDGIDYDSAWHVLYRLLRPLLDDFDIDFFTLNYDQVVDVAVYGLSMLSGKKLLDGFGQVIDMENSRLFRADQYAIGIPTGARCTSRSSTSTARSFLRITAATDGWPMPRGSSLCERKAMRSRGALGERQQKRPLRTTLTLKASFQ